MFKVLLVYYFAVKGLVVQALTFHLINFSQLYHHCEIKIGGAKLTAVMCLQKSNWAVENSCL